MRGPPAWRWQPSSPCSSSIDPADFGGPIDNPYLPLRPGTTFRYRGVGDDGKTPELNTLAVTHKTKRIMGIDAVVVLDQVFSNGKPQERTFDWYAQDHEGQRQAGPHHARPPRARDA